MSALPPFPSLRDRVAMALAEDLGTEGDVTSNAVFGPGAMGEARVVAKAPGVLFGGEPFALVFEILGGVTVEQLVPDGATVAPGDVVMRLSGSVRHLLAGERTALNLLQRLSGVATATAAFVRATGGRIAICDTRKTTPLWRDVEKQAVAAGGGTNHRMGLHDMVMLKDTHADGAGSLAEALRRVAPLAPRLRIAAEARDLAEVRDALAAGVDLLMLDNMDADTLRAAVALIAGRAVVEITGGITPATAAAAADLGVDRVSVGALTHSAPALDLSMRLDAASIRG